jgi:hypothetical protein
MNAGGEGDIQLNRSLFFTLENEKKLGLATTMEHAVLEVLTVPDDYTDSAAQQIAESVLLSGAIENRARTGTRGGPIRITWAALVEKGIAVGVLAQEDA